LVQLVLLGDRWHAFGGFQVIIILFFSSLQIFGIANPLKNKFFKRNKKKPIAEKSE